MILERALLFVIKIVYKLATKQEVDSNEVQALKNIINLTEDVNADEFRW